MKVRLKQSIKIKINDVRVIKWLIEYFSWQQKKVDNMSNKDETSTCIVGGGGCGGVATSSSDDLLNRTLTSSSSGGGDSASDVSRSSSPNRTMDSDDLETPGRPQ